MNQEIQRLKEERNAVILAHNYQVGEVQDAADFIGDSLELARAAARLDCDVIVFCGVDFMAETAAVLSPEKCVVLPEKDACCPMAQMVTAQQIIDARELYPDAAVVAYVNTTAEVKAESDICCTSANAVEVVAAVPSSQIIMVPDENLGRYVARHTSKEIIPWNGFCYVHDRFLVEGAISAKSAHPSAELLVHPECRPEVIDLADKVLSTSGMSRHAKTSRSKEFIIGTEVGMLYRLEKENPDKRFYPLSKKAVCQNMKKTNLAKVERALESLKTQVEVSSDVSERARLSIQRMLDLKM